jgi:hypothetical protein
MNKRQNLTKNQCLRIYVFCIQKMCRVAARRLSIYNFAWGPLKASNLQAESKILKKNIGTPKSINQNKKFLKKTVIRSLKVDRGQKYARTEFAGPTRNPSKL